MKTKHIPFLLLAVVTILLATATFVEKRWGTAVAMQGIYTSWWFVALWVALAVSAAVVFARPLRRRPAVLLLHIALLVVCAGALVTHLWGERGVLHLRQGQEQEVFQDTEDNSVRAFPFTVSLRSFRVECYPGTQSPMDYVSEVDVTDGDRRETMTISMNRIGEYRGYRFYQSGYDEDAQGTTLSIGHDPWGIAITYTGYGLLFLAMLLIIGGKMLAARRKAAMLLACCLLPMTSFAESPSARPKALPRHTAEQFGRLYVYHNGRICPFQTLAKDFVTKLYGKASYRDYTPEQVVTGFLFYPMDWVEEPIIKVKGAAKERLGLREGSHASYRSFFGTTDGYLLERPMADIHAGKSVDGARSLIEADEKMNILLMLFNGQLLRIFPYRDGRQLQWLSPGGSSQPDMPEDKWLFVKKSVDYMGELVWMKRWHDLDDIVAKVRAYQQKEAIGLLPGDRRFYAERLYNTAERSKPLAMVLLTAGFLSLLLIGWRRRRMVAVVVNVLLVASLLYLLFVISLRGYVSGHLPLSNGHETMQFMALCALLVALPLQRRSPLAVPFALLIAGFTLLVSVMGEANPQITPLMPVLASPLLSLHVCIIMLAYSLLAFTMLSSLTALILHILPRHSTNLPPPSPLLPPPSSLLLPAVFLLAAGIFIGAIWANVSWGTYWNWDPKETWALITLLVYAVPLHWRSLRWLRRPLYYHLYMVLAFLTILMTYFGVNFFLGGMHSYA